jgi:hypothetical protein
MMNRLVTVLILCGTLPSCGGAKPFVSTFVEKAKPGAASILRSLSKIEPRQERAVVAGVTAEPSELFVWEMDKGLLWRRPVDARSAPRVAGSLVVTHETGGVVARDLESGEELFTVGAQARLVGADGYGETAVIALVTDPEEQSRGIVVGVEQGDIAWEREADFPVGVPAVANGFVILPWATNRLSLLDAKDGEELARLQMKDSVSGHAVVDGGYAYVGQHGIFRVNPRMQGGTKQDAVYHSPVARPMPGQPGLLREAYEPVPPPDHAGHRVDLSWRAGGKDDVIRIEDDTIYLRFYRFVFALDAESDAIRWTYQGKADVSGIAVQPGGIFLADTEGKLLFLSSLGHPVWQQQMELSPVAAHIRPGSLIPQAQEAKGGKSAPEKPAALLAEMPPLQEQLIAAAELDDPRLAGGRAFAVEHLSRFEGADITDRLLRICDNAKAPEPVRHLACDKLAERKLGQKHILTALDRSASFIDDTSPPAAGALARAAAALKLKAASPLLVRHLQDPDTPAAGLQAVIEALATLGYSAAAAPLEKFLNLHHAEPWEQHLAAALKAAIKALAALRGKAADSALKRVAADPMSMEGLRPVAEQTLAALQAPTKPATAGKKAEAEKKDAAPAAAPAEKEDRRPHYLSMGVVDQVLRPADAKLRRCFARDEAKSLRARISMVVHGKGNVERIFVTPTSMQQCVEEVLQKYEFPPTRSRRQQVVYVVQRTKRGRTPAGAPKLKSKRKARKARGKPAGKRSGKPADKPAGKPPQKPSPGAASHPGKKP